MNKLIVNIKWVSYNDKSLDNSYMEDIGTWGGFFSEGMRWKDYLETIDSSVHPYLEILRAEIVKLGIKCGGDLHQSPEMELVPVFSDNKYATYSFRGWGDLLAAIWSEEEDKDYCYMDFYMQCLIDNKKEE